MYMQVAGWPSRNTVSPVVKVRIVTARWHISRAPRGADLGVGFQKRAFHELWKVELLVNHAALLPCEQDLELGYTYVHKLDAPSNVLLAYVIIRSL